MTILPGVAHSITGQTQPILKFLLMTQGPDRMPAHDGRLMRAPLGNDLVAAMKARHLDAVTALRTTIAAIDNAEAVDTPGHGQPQASEHIAGARAGVGATEAERRDLTASTVRAILHARVSERIAEAERYDAHGHTTAADRLRREANALTKYGKRSPLSIDAHTVSSPSCRAPRWSRPNRRLAAPG